MVNPVTYLPRLDVAPPLRDDALTAAEVAAHPMRKVTRQVAFEPGGWTAERRAKVAELFDSLAPEWHTRFDVHRPEPILDAFARGGLTAWGTSLEIGSGTGLLSATISAPFRRSAALDLSAEMLALAPSSPPRIQGDSGFLPIADGSIDALVLVNTFLFPVEASRVVSADGCVVWVNTSGDRTPIHLPAEEVAMALGPGWHGVASEAAWGTWVVLHRD